MDCPKCKSPMEEKTLSTLHGGVTVDRCTGCHLGVENSAMVDAEQPLKTHSGDWLANHPPDRFDPYLGQPREDAPVAAVDQQGVGPVAEEADVDRAVMDRSSQRALVEAAA